jgi:hypothetical protein
VDGRAVSANADRTVVRIPLGEGLAAGRSASISFNLNVVAPKGTDRSGQYPQGMVAFGNLLPVVAPIDEEGVNVDPYVVAGESFYSIAAPWKVKVAGPDGWTFATTGASSTASGGPTVDATTAKSRDFLIVAMKGWEQKSQVVDGTTIRSWAPVGSADKSALMLSAASEALTYFNRRFGAYEGDGEYELIAAPGMGGGMEYPGITLNDTNSPRSFLREVVIHETGHQWFYSMVGNNQHDDPWLDESFTSYITAEYLRAPAIDVATRLAPAIHGRRDRAPGSGRPLGPSNLPVRVSSPMSVLNGRGYVNMIYGEGARVLERLRRELGDEIFVRGMREHVATAKHGIASTAKFIEIMSNAAGRDLTGWFANNKVLATEPEAGKQHDPNRLV